VSWSTDNVSKKVSWVQIHEQFNTVLHLPNGKPQKKEMEKIKIFPKA
jgi:hypothetical protein